MSQIVQNFEHLVPFRALNMAAFSACEPRTSDLRSVVPTKKVSLLQDHLQSKRCGKEKKYSKMHAFSLNQSSMVNGPDPNTFFIRTTVGYTKMEAGC